MGALGKLAKWLSHSLIWLVLVSVVLIGGGLAWLQTGSGQAWLARTIEDTVSTADLGIRIGGLSGSVPFDLTVSALEISDADGVWLEADRARLAMRPADLWQGRLTLALVANRLAVHRPPGGAAVTDGGEETGDPLSFPDLPLAITVQELSVADLMLGAALTGLPEPARLAVTLFGDADSDGVALAAGVDRLDAPGQVKANLGYDAAARRIDADITATEPAGGLAASLLALPGTPPVSVSLIGAGTLAAGSGRLAVDLGDLGRVAADLDARAVAEGYRAALVAQGEGLGLLPADWQALVGPSPSMEALVVAAEDLSALRIERLEAFVAAGRVGADGAVDLVKDRLSLRLDAETTEVVLPLGDGAPSWSAADLSATAEGALLGPVVRLTLDAGQLAGYGFGAAEASAKVALDPVEGRPLVFRTTAEVTAPALTTPVPSLSALTSDGPRVDVRGIVDLNTLTATEVVASARIPAVAVDAQAALIDIAALTGQAEATVRVADLGQLAAVLPGLAGGSAVAQLRGALDADGLTADTELLVQGLSVGDPAFDGVLGEDIRLETAVSLADRFSRIEVSRLQGEGPGLTVSGTGTIGDGRIRTDLSVNLGDLAPYGAIAGLDAGGAVRFEVTADGPLDGPEATARVSLQDLAWQGRPIGGVDLSMTAPSLFPEARLTATLEGTLAGQPVAGSFALAHADSRLQVDKLELATGNNRLEGEVQVALDRLLADGRLTATLPDLSVLEPLLGQAIAGGVSASVVLAETDRGQSVRAEARAENALVAGTGLRQAILTATTDGPDLAALAAPGTRVAATVEVADVTAGAAGISSAQARLQGDLSNLAIQLTMLGQMDGTAVAADAQATLAMEPAAMRVTLGDATLGYANERFRLLAPATMTLAEGGISLSEMRLSVDGGVLSARGGLQGETLDGRLTVDAIPVALARLVAPGLGLAGRLDGSVALSGAMGAPTVAAKIDVSGLRSTRITGAAGGPYTIGVEADWRDSVLAVRGQASQERRDDVRLAISLRMPVPAAPGSVVPVIGETTAVAGTVTGRGRLALLNDFLAVSGDRAEGMATVDLSIGGQLGKPALDGAITVADGRYENRATGMVLSNIEALIRGNGDQLRFERMTARAGDSGRIDVGGTIRPAEMLVDLTLTARQAEVIDIQIATVGIDADLAVRGSPSDGEVTGRVGVLRAELRVPEQLPPQVVVLEVEEIGRPTNEGGLGGLYPPLKPRPARAPSAAPASSPPPTAGGIRLDIGVGTSRQVFLRGRGLEAQFDGDLKVLGTADKPRLDGTLRLVSGQFALLGRRLTLGQGTIGFRGLPVSELNPDLDLSVGSADVASAGGIIIGGTLERPEINFGGGDVPPDEVLSQVLFGKDRGQLSVGEAATLADSAAELMGFGGSSSVIGGLRRALGVDRFEVTGEGVAAGKYISEGIYVGVEQNLGSSTGGTGSQATVEVDITDNIQAEAGVSGSGGPSVGIKFQWDY